MLLAPSLILPWAVNLVAATTPRIDTEPPMPSVVLDYTTLIAAAGNSSLGYYKYQNIRYAQPPISTLRWIKPQWPIPEFSPNTGSLAAPDVACSTEEDCLFMDMWAPADAVGRNLPVMVFTHGGRFVKGAKSENGPEGLFDLSKDFIYVSYNYRLGMTGLASGVTLNHEGASSNVALWDAEHAFWWIRKYISNFGGNPEDVAAVGFSAGASQLLFQMTRFAGRGEQLFNRAWIMSPGYLPGAGNEQAESFWQNVSTAVGCGGGAVDCMQTVNFDTLNSAATDISTAFGYALQPRVDGDFVTDTYESLLYQNRFNFTGPLIITHEQHEINSVAWPSVNVTADIATNLRIFFPSISDSVIAEVCGLYPEEDYSSPGLRFADMKQAWELTAHNLALTHALKNQTWNGMIALGPAVHGTDQKYYFYTTYTLTNTTIVGGGGPGGDKSIDPAIAIKMQKYLISLC
ncbi:hypothetical protein HYALB_00002694 [Hymenoscyphus albidus]|uniref:Carboxylesterase type B domain-containing protein n=1 Tax=Hymenoscyphus albidus TaxID=595503 RepID=A0A9N9LYB4_9HELO|nr:hypothetical protein HYALB_00002694 [Hymenoscyphus albidus]